MSSTVIHDILRGDYTVIDKIYDQYKPEFIRYLSKNYSLAEDEATEIFQFSVVTFYENVINGKLVELSSSLKTYLFAIGKNQALDSIKKSGRRPVYDLSNFDFEENDPGDEEFLEMEKIYEKISNSLEELGEVCRDLLKYFYYERKNMTEIADLMGYTSTASAKNQKYRCFQKLKALVFRTDE